MLRADDWNLQTFRAEEFAKRPKRQIPRTPGRASGARAARNDNRKGIRGAPKGAPFQDSDALSPKKRFLMLSGNGSAARSSHFEPFRGF
jgi:hypothetical protein